MVQDFTDGLSESLNDNGEEIGIDGSIKIIEQNYNKETTKQLDNITKSVINVSKSQKLSDDLTLICRNNIYLKKLLIEKKGRPNIFRFYVLIELK